MRAHIPHLRTSPHPHVIPRLREESRTCALTSLISTPLHTPMSFRGGRPKVRRGMNPSPGRGRSPCRRSAEAEAESKGRAGAGLSPPPIPVSFRGSTRNLELARSHPSSPHLSPHPHVIPRLREESRTCALTSLISTTFSRCATNKPKHERVECDPFTLDDTFP